MSLMPIFAPYVSSYAFANISYDSVSTSLPLVSSRGIACKPDGTSIFTVGNDADSIRRLDLSTAWDLSTASTGTSISLSFDTFSGTHRNCLSFSDDGNKVFVANSSNIEEHALSSSYGGSATYTTKIAVPAGTMRGFTFTADGTKIIATTVDGEFRENTLSTAYDLSTAGGWGLVLLDLSATHEHVQGIHLDRNDTRMVLTEGQFSGTGVFQMHQYKLTTAGDISTATLESSYTYSTDTGGVNAGQAVYGDSGRKLFVSTQNTVEQYSTVN